MADGKNEARALRVLEIMNDYRTLQVHIRDVTTRPGSNPTDPASANLPGYVLIRQCTTEAQGLLTKTLDPGSQQPGNVPATEVQKAALQRIILDASASRFRAHRVYLRGMAATRWIQMRSQIMGQGRPAQQPEALRRIDQRLGEEVGQITDSYVYSELRNTDQRKSYWIEEDPSLERITAWIRSQR